MNDLQYNSVGSRIRRLGRYLGCETDAALARKVGVSSQVLNRSIRRGAISRKLASRFLALVPGLTRDWLEDGNPIGLPLHLAQSLEPPPGISFTIR
jgi:hypothetical protein